MNHKLILIPVMFLLVPTIIFAVDNRFFVNETFDDNTDCAINWVIGGCNCNTGFMSCPEGQTSYYIHNITPPSLATNVTCEFKFRQNQVLQDPGLSILRFDAENGTAGGLNEYVVVRANSVGPVYDFFGRHNDPESSQISVFTGATFPSPWATARFKFLSNGSRIFEINETFLAQIDGDHPKRQDTGFFQAQVALAFVVNLKVGAVLFVLASPASFLSITLNL